MRTLVLLCASYRLAVSPDVFSLYTTEEEVIALWNGIYQLATFFRNPADVVRRNAPIFNGETALDRIIAGDIAGVVEAYDKILMYQSG